MKYDIKITKVKESRLPQLDFDNIPFGKVFSDHMFVANYEDGAWVNPRIEPFGPFQIHPASMVLHYGQSVFEGMKASKSLHGKPMLLRPDMHAKRLNASGARMCIPEIPEDLFLEAVHTLVDLDKDWIPPKEGSALYIRPYVYATDEFIGVKPAETYTFCIFTGPVGPYYAKPVRLLAEETFVRAVKGGTGEAKAAGNYAASLLPARLAQQKGFDQVMWLDGNEFKYVQEVGTMNIFFVIDGKVVTPATDGAILKGITRYCVMDLLKDKGYTVEERPVTINEVMEAHAAGKLEEVFGTGTAAVVSVVEAISYQGKTIEIAPAGPESISTLAKAEIDGLRSGRIEDAYSWVVPVDSPALINM